jgi:preprotein translocase subunit SecF
MCNSSKTKLKKILFRVFNTTKSVLISKFILCLFSKTYLAKFELGMIFFNFISEMSSLNLILKSLFVLPIYN